MAAEEWATLATNQIVGKIQTFPQSLSIPFCFLPDLTGVKFGSTCPPLAGAAEFPTGGNAPTPLGCRLAPPTNRTDQPATGRSLRRSSGTRYSRAVPATRGRPALVPLPATPFVPLLFLLNFQPVGSSRPNFHGRIGRSKATSASAAAGRSGCTCDGATRRDQRPSRLFSCD